MEVSFDLIIAVTCAYHLNSNLGGGLVNGQSTLEWINIQLDRILPC